MKKREGIKSIALSEPDSAAYAEWIKNWNISMQGQAFIPIETILETTQYRGWEVLGVYED